MSPARAFLFGSIVVVMLVAVLAQDLGRRGFSPPEPHEHEAVLAAGAQARNDAYLEAVATAQAVDRFLADLEGRRLAALKNRKQQTEVRVIAATAGPHGPWDALARCESTSRWDLNTGNGYYGGLQADMTFWRTYGGLAYAPRPDLASKAQQITVAARARDGYGPHQARGYRPWPTCARRLGLIGEV